MNQSKPSVFITHTISKFCTKKMSLRDWTESKKLQTLFWSLRGLSIYGKVTIIKSLTIPKLVYISLFLPVPKENVKELNQMIYKFFWKGTDKVTRLSTIRLSDLTNRYYRNIIYKLPFNELFDTDH